MNEASLRKPLFGKEVEIAIRGMDERLASPIMEDAYAEGLRLQKLFNFYDKDSLISKLNRKRALDAPDEFLHVLNGALALCERTEGRYDVSLGGQFSARKRGEPVSRPSCSYRDIAVSGSRVELTHPEAMLDLGSIAKGYIADRMASFMGGEGVLGGLIDARGDIRVFGEEEWRISVQHPREEEKALCSLALRDGGVATSGDYSQYDRTHERPHILNNRDYISVTTLAGTLMEADAYATAVFVTPAGGVPALLEGTNIKAMCVKKDLGIDYFNGFEGCLSG